MGGTRLTTEEELFYYCNEVIHDIAGTYSGTLVVCGGGKSFWEDYAKAKELLDGQEYDTIASNIAGLFIPELDHLFSLHHRNISHLANWRKVEYPENKAICHSIAEYPGVDYAWRLSMPASTSGLMAVVMGKILGYDKFILCGVPMDDSGYFYKPELNETFPDPSIQREIPTIKNRFGDSVRSMSGRTRLVLGTPTEEWVKEKNYASTK